MDTIAIRKDAIHYRKKKEAIRKCIIKSIDDEVKGGDLQFLHGIDYEPYWWKKFKSMPNNLNRRKNICPVSGFS